MYGASVEWQHLVTTKNSYYTKHMPHDYIAAEATKAIPGVVGSLGALIWIKGTMPRRVAMVLLGSATSYYATPYLVVTLGMGEGLTGFLIGLFGMSVVDSIFKTWQELGLSEILREFIRKRLGLSPKETE